MEVEESDQKAVKSEIDLYGDDDNFEQLQNDEVVVGDVHEDELQNEDENGVLGETKEEEGIGEDVGVDLSDDHPPGVDEDIDAAERRQSEADDLYDAVITDRTSPGVGRQSRDENGDSSSPSPNSRSGGLVGHAMVTGSGTMNQAQRKNSCYVGNLTWWTTDQDLTDVVSAIGLSDVIDVKFYENRANGQSKGFALVSFESENSVRICMERLPSKQIHSQVPVVLPYTKQSLAQFEAATRKPGERAEGGQGGQPTTPTGRTPTSGLTGSGGGKGSAGPQDKAPTFLGVLRIGAGGQSRGPAQSGGGQVGMNQLAAAAAAAAAVARSTMAMGHGPPGVVMQNSGPGGMMPPGMGPLGSMAGFPAMMRPHVSMGGPMGPGAGPPPMISRPPPPGAMGGGHGMHPGAMMRGPPSAAQYAGAPIMAGHHGGGMPPPGVPPPGSHVNPNFYPGLAAAHQQQQAAAHHGHHDAGAVLSEAEFEEIMNRNRTVSSSAISRAVSDAAAGDYASAIETLVTALSLIRQSKVAHDDRCKVLIGSLQDTLHGIEAKSYGSGGPGAGSHHGGSGGGASRRSKDRGSARERSRSRDRAGGGSKRRHRSRTRSRSRERYGDEYSPRRRRY